MKTKAYQIWWADNNPLHNAGLAKKYFPNVHYSAIEDRHIEYMYKKEVK